ncbi:MAG TPA: hypothetical protein VF532_13220 [Candidatus Angelobacter sp.]
MLLQASFATNPPSPIDLGPSAVGVTTPMTQTSVLDRPLLIINSGSTALTLSYSFSSPEFSFDPAATPANPLTVQPGASATGGLLFKPSAAGPRSGQFTSTDNASGSPHVVQLSGTGITVPDNDFGVFLDPSGPSAITVRAGQSTSFTAWILVGPGLSTSPSVFTMIDCSGGPSGTSCTSNPSGILGPLNFQFASRRKLNLSVSVPAGAAASHRKLPILASLVCMFGVFAVIGWRRDSRPLASLGVLVLCASMISCGGGGSGNVKPLVITVSAVGFGVTHTLTVPLQVK